MNKLISINKASELLNVCTKTLRTWDNEGKLKSIKTIGGHRRYKQEDIDNFILKENKIELVNLEEKLKNYQDAINFSIDNMKIKIEIAIEKFFPGLSN